MSEGRAAMPACVCETPVGQVGRLCRVCGGALVEQPGQVMAPNVQPLVIEETYTARRQRAQMRERAVRRNRSKAVFGGKVL